MGSRLAYLETPEGGTRSSSHRAAVCGPWTQGTSYSCRQERYASLVTSDKSDALTAAQKAQLEAELAELEGPRRTEAVQAIATARSFGDLSENFEYHAAKNEQGLLERRITMLRDRLERSVIIDESDVDGDTVGVGTKVEIEDDQGERMEVEISSVGGVSPDSPVGRALMGRKVSDEVEIQAPSGAWRARILSIGR
jgi:transcription elongation factor GreA